MIFHVKYKTVELLLIYFQGKIKKNKLIYSLIIIALYGSDIPSMENLVFCMFVIFFSTLQFLLYKKKI